MLSLDSITIRYGADRPVRDLTIDLDAPSTAIMGPSGSGKSSLLRVIAGHQRPDAGVVLLDDRAVRAASWQQSSDPRVILVYQDYRLVDFLSVGENLALAAHLRDLTIDRDQIVAHLNAVELGSEFLDRAPATLSGGEQQRVAIARALASKPYVLLADEPTGALDAETTSTVMRVLVAATASMQVQLLVATHDQQVADLTDEVYDLEGATLRVRTRA